MKKVLVLFLAVSVVAVIAIYVVRYVDDYARYGRFRETPAVHPHEEPLLVMQEGSVPYEGGEEIFKNTPAESLVSPFRMADPETLKLGKALYFTFCAQCHGKDHDGNGTVGQSFFPLPTDLRSDRVQSLLEGVFFKEISYGVPGGRQPPLATTIEPGDRWRIIAYLQSLGTRR